MVTECFPCVSIYVKAYIQYLNYSTCNPMTGDIMNSISLKGEIIEK